MTPVAHLTTSTYDPEDQLTQVSLPDGTTASYRYDGLGRRIEKCVTSTCTRYVYDQEDILLEFDGTNTLTARYLHGPGIDQPVGILMDQEGDCHFTTFAGFSEPALTLQTHRRR